MTQETPAAPTTSPDATTAAGRPVLTPQELVGDDGQAFGALKTHLATLEAMPDGQRPPAPGTERPRWRRRTYMVDWKLQLNYASVYVFTIALLLTGFVTLNMIFYFFAQRMLKLYQRGAIPETESFTYYLFANAIFVILLAMGMALYAIIQSHRVAGPALRFHRALRQILRRDYDFHMQLRRKDYLQELADQVNTLVSALKAKDIVIADAALRLDEAAKQLAAKGHDATAVKQAARELADTVLPLPEPSGEGEAVARVDGARA